MIGKNSILIVDDENSNLTYLNYILSADYTVYEARNASEAIAAAKEYLPDLILLDVIMPGMDGFEALAMLKESEKTAKIPVVYITGLDSSDDEMKGLALGAEDYITKPFSDTVVKLRVRNQIKIVNQTRALEKEILERKALEHDLNAALKLKTELAAATELAAQSSSAKNDFLSRMSYEMRASMNAIIGMTSLALSADDAEKRMDCIIKANSASRNLLRLIDDVLDISDIEDGKFYVIPSESNFASMLQSIFDEAGLYIDEKYQAFTIDIDPSIPKFLICDEKRIAQVITNLLSNAGKFTGDHGLIQFRAFVINVENNLLTIQVEVIDNGIGISKEKQEKIFIAFEHVDGSVCRKYGGAGLGLPISKSIVKMMDGDIWVESEIGKGSKFAFTFKAQVKTPDVNDGESVSFKGKTALLVEDVEINREIVMTMLEDTRLQIVCAANGREAVELYSSDPKKFDVVFMDINMPEMDGVQATRCIRALEIPEAQQVPIIAVTVNVLPKEIRSYLAAGITDHIGKPIDFDKLLRKISLYMR